MTPSAHRSCSWVYCSSASMVGRFCSMPYGYQSSPMIFFSSSIIGCSQANDAFGAPVLLVGVLQQRLDGRAVLLDAVRIPILADDLLFLLDHRLQPGE